MKRRDPRVELGARFREANLPLGCRLVLLAMLSYANYTDWENARCSQGTIVKFAGLSRNTVQRSLRRLVEAGFVTVVESKVGKAATYSVRLPATPESGTPDLPPSEVAPPATPRVAPPATFRGGTTFGTARTKGMRGGSPTGEPAARCRHGGLFIGDGSGCDKCPAPAVSA